MIVKLLKEERMRTEAMGEILSEWEFQRDGEFVWWKRPKLGGGFEMHSLGPAEQAMEKMAEFLAQQDFGE